MTVRIQHPGMMFPMEGAAAHAMGRYPDEAAGLWVDVGDGPMFRPCGRGTRDGFRIAPGEWLEAERLGAVRGIFHSHPDAPPVPSPADAAAMDAWGLPWVILSVPSMELAEYVPEGGRARPLLGRRFEYGGDDCYGLIRDYYRRLGVALPDVPRAPGWERRGLSLYLDNREMAGFALVDGADPAPGVDGAPAPPWAQGPHRQHDVLLMQIHSPVPNHGAVYLGDGLMLHHIDGRLSARAVYGDFWRKATTHILRHRELC